ncbi:MAG TPA: rod shape-determining protein MreC [Vicinamibacterales bacterium]|nr:rod shape-determining protein MreC [Vicinamibacterales bacterium]
MSLLDIRQRAGSLFVVVIVGHIILISAQVQSKSGVPLIANAAFSGFAAVQRSVAAVVTGGRNVWRGYVGLRDVRDENEALKRQLADARFQAHEQRARADRTRSLEQLLGLRARLDLKTAAASVIAAGAVLDFRSITLDKGAADGFKTDMAVLAPEGVVGRIVATSPHAAQVQLLIDGNAAAGGIIERSRAQGIVIGAGDKGFLLTKVPEAADIVVGDIVVTSGIEGVFAIYPKGFVVGRVETITKRGLAYEEITVKPAVDFSKLEDVLVVLTTPPSGAPAQEAGH